MVIRGWNAVDLLREFDSEVRAVCLTINTNRAVGPRGTPPLSKWLPSK
jgi:hypothetical protein